MVALRSLARSFMGVVVLVLFLGFPSPFPSFQDLPEPLRPFRPIAVALLNYALHNVPFPSLEGQDIMASAQRTTGLTDFDDADHIFQRGLDILSESLQRESKLNFVGRLLTRAQLDIVVENRLKIAKQFRVELPLNKRIVAPIIVAGMPRSGTTFLHNLLSLDEDNFRAPRLWEIVDPLPALYRVPNRTLERWFRKTHNQLGTTVFRYLAPNFAAVHPVDSMNAEECMPILSLSMLSFNFFTMSNVTTYNEWLMAQNQTEALLWHKKFLSVSQTTQASTTWLVKAPWHMNHLESLFDVYPDARVLVPHRDPDGMLASLSSLHARLFGLSSDTLDLKALGKYVQRTWETILDRFVRARRKLQDKQIFDLSHSELIRDPMKSIDRLYTQLNLTLSVRAKSNMEAWLVNDVKLGKKGASGVHHYRAEWFGLDSSGNGDFQEYVKEYHAYLL